MKNAARHEARAHRVDMPVTACVLLVGEKPLRHDEVQIILGTGHCHIEKPANASEVFAKVSAALAVGCFGLVRYTDGVTGTKRRLETAKRNVPDAVSDFELPPNEDSVGAIHWQFHPSVRARQLSGTCVVRFA